jgi:hypothetical protein
MNGPSGSRVPWVACALLLGCGGALEESRPPDDPEELRVEIETFLGSYLGAIEARDAVTLRDQLAESSRYLWVEEGAIRYRSVENMLKGLAAFPPDTPLETDFSLLHVARVGSDGAHAAGSFETRVGTGPASFSFSGLMTFALERSAGSWRIVGGHVSSPPPGDRGGPR